MQIQRIVVDWAVRYGILEAIVFDVLLRLIQQESYEYQGLTWLPLSIMQLQAEIPYASSYRLRVALELLADEGLLIVAANKNRLGIKKRRRLSYAFTEKGMALAEGIKET